MCVADGDPHFVVDFPLSKLTVCFNINGEPGHVLRLVTDHTKSGQYTEKKTIITKKNNFTVTAYIDTVCCVYM